jgi:hypothetical protein
MTDKPAPASAQLPVEDARDLLMRLYRDIGISALAAALEVARLPAPEDVRSDAQIHDLPGILRDHELAA